MTSHLKGSVLEARNLAAAAASDNLRVSVVYHAHAQGIEEMKTESAKAVDTTARWTSNNSFQFAVEDASKDELRVVLFSVQGSAQQILGETTVGVRSAVSATAGGTSWIKLATTEKSPAGEILLALRLTDGDDGHHHDYAPLALTSPAVSSGKESKVYGSKTHSSAGPVGFDAPPDLNRRFQTGAVMFFFIMPWLCLLASYLLIRSGGLRLYLFLGYIAFIVASQEYHRKGGHKQMWFRKLPLWTWFATYFPVRLHRQSPIDCSTSYIFGYHPHGVLSLGAFANFGTEATGFSSLFPGVNMHVCTLRTNFYIPFYGLYLTALGICDASKEGILHILGKGPGSAVCLVLGGAKESLDSRPGTYDLTLSDRKGFVKLALQTGASLVPCFSFGETDLYDQVENPGGSRLRVLQNKLQEQLGFAIPLIKGRGIFTYDAGMLPHRRPINTVVGTPIPVPKIPVKEITDEMITQYHRKYMEHLEGLFHSYKNEFAPHRLQDIRFVQ